MSATEPLVGASLTDPHYYRRNLETVVQWVMRHYQDVLTPDERAHFSALMRLPAPARALLTRLIMRQGAFFRVDALDYPEIAGDLTPVLETLHRAGFLTPDELPTPDDLGRLFRLSELARARHAIPGEPVASPGGRKRDLLVWLRACAREQYLLVTDYLRSESPWLSLTHPAWYERLRLLFFGNRRQTWADFVLVALGHAHYETVTLTGNHRPFRNRIELLTYERLSAARDHLEEMGDLDAAVHAIPGFPVRPEWLESRRSRVLMSLGSQAYRQRQWGLALRAWALSEQPEAQVRRARLLEQRGFRDQAARECEAALESPLPDTAKDALVRVLNRCRPPSRRPVRRPPPIPTASMSLTMPRTGQRVEQLAAEALSAGGRRAYYTENTLFAGLFGLVFWHALFAPVAGAFFHPFQAGPADLYDPEFTHRRRALIEQALNRLSSEAETRWVLETYDAKFGITNRFVHWQALPRDLVETVLHLIPRDQLVAVLSYMLDDLTRHRSGFPDLLVITPNASRYELIEVKGPGDQLQPQQTRFLLWCQTQGIPASVLHVLLPRDDSDTT